MKRDIKFRLIKDDKIVGYEMWHENRWVYRFPEQDNFSLYTPFIPHNTKDEFVGLKDKNSVEIYEGDIVNLLGGEEYNGYWEHNIIGTMEWYRSGFDLDNAIYDPECDTLEVIGNIYENSELLGEHYER